jgi:hypothetical protein
MRSSLPTAQTRGWVKSEIGSGLFGDLRDENAFEDIARTAVGLVPTSPCVLLSARRGPMTAPEHIGLATAHFDPKENCLSDNPDRFASFAVLLALAHAAPTVYDEHKRVQRMWKAVERHMPFMPRAHAVDGLRLILRNREGILIGLDELSDGERAALLLLAEVALRHPEHGLVLIDEIEQHLHLRWQTEILDALTALEPTAQFVITTQADYVAASAPRDALRIADWEADPHAQ